MTRSLMLIGHLGAALLSMAASPAVGAWAKFRRSIRWSEDQPAAESMPAQIQSLRSFLSSSRGEARLAAVRQLSRLAHQARPDSITGGVGIGLKQAGPDFIVDTAVPGMPAAKAGVQHGDVILRVNGESTREMDLAMLVERLRGKAGDPVRVVFDRPSRPNPIEVALVRDVLSEEQREIITLLVNCIRDSDALVRLEAISTMQDMGRQAYSAVPAIIRALDDKDARVQEAARSALKVLDLPDSRRALENRR